MGQSLQYLLPLHFSLPVFQVSWYLQCMSKTFTKTKSPKIWSNAYIYIHTTKRNLTLVFLVKTEHPTITLPQICNWNIAILGNRQSHYSLPIWARGPWTYLFRTKVNLRIRPTANATKIWLPTTKCTLQEANLIIRSWRSRKWECMAA